MLLVSVMGTIISPANAREVNIRVAAASDLRFAMPTLVHAFEAEFPDYNVNVVYGSSGRFYGQIRNGAPFHIYFSADIYYPQQLLNADRTDIPESAMNRSVYPYAEGTLAIWTLKKNNADETNKVSSTNPLNESAINTDFSSEWLQRALKQRGGRIAIANPQHAPYGARALEWLQQHSLWPEIESRLVFAENVAQVAHFVRSGSAQVGILALPLALSTELSEYGDFLAIPADQYSPITQGMLITEYGSEHAGTIAFFNFMQSLHAKDILMKAGFFIPSQRDFHEPE